MIEWLATVVHRLQHRHRNREWACYYTAMVMYGCDVDTASAWRMASFFEKFLNEGGGATEQEFWPRPPVDLKAVTGTS